MKRKDLIPIVYMSGLGGHFVSSFLCNTRDANIENWNFGVTGVCHFLQKDFIPTGNVTVPSEIHLQVLLNEPINNVVKYYPTHMTDVVLAHTHFDKVIKIYCEESDIEDVLKVYSKKVSEGIPAKTAEKINYAWLKVQVEKYKDAWRPNFELEPHVLNISWKELVYESPENIIKKLSGFTSLPIASFQIDKLEQWRNLTLACIYD